MPARIALLTSLLALLVAPLAWAGVGADGPLEGATSTVSSSEAQYDGEAVSVSVRCLKAEAPCSGAVTIATAGAPVGGAAPYAIEAESGERVRVALTPPGVTAMNSAAQVQITLVTPEGTSTVTRNVTRIPSPEGFVEGQTPTGNGTVTAQGVKKTRACPKFGRAASILATVTSCKQAKTLIAAVVKRGCSPVCNNVQGYRCLKKNGKFDCLNDRRRVRWTVVARQK
jgi:hypothetical protein